MKGNRIRLWRSLVILVIASLIGQLALPAFCGSCRNMIGKRERAARFLVRIKERAQVIELRRFHKVQQNLEVVRVDTDKNLLLVKGAVPGPKGADVVIRPAVKAKKK